jgi:oxygen-independent coproporphyrinogen-3 oxidase
LTLKLPPTPCDHGDVAFGVYVHVPFCARRCDYCDFATWDDRGHLMEAYARACVKDLNRRAAPEATSVFFGGGTPSLLPAPLLTSILDAITCAPGAEVTVECNPDAVDPAKLAAYRAAGVDRLSFGVQSMRTHVLRSLGRTHDPGNVAQAVRWAREAGFDNLNLDVIYGAAGESLDDWRATLEGVIALGPEHVSAYGLTVESGTPLDRRVAAGEVGAPDDDDQADKYLLADDLLGEAGYRWYEISNWSRPARECRHNILYWSSGQYLAIGCAAHGYTGGRRWWNVRTPDRYIDLIGRDASPEAGGETLDSAGRADEALALTLRLATGADVPDDDGLVADGLAGWSNGRLVLTRRGRLLGNAVAARLLLAAERRRAAAAPATGVPVSPR